MQKRSVGVLISGRGSNLQALIDAALPIRVVISNRGDAAGLARAERAGIETLVLPHKTAASRAAYDRQLIAALKERGIEVVALAGFMRLLGKDFCDAFPHAILNVHPSLLPKFPGVDAPAQAIAAGATVSGCTVHLVTPALDAGPILMQAAVPVHSTDTAETLSARILVEEHAIFPDVVRRVVDERLRQLDGVWTVA